MFIRGSIADKALVEDAFSCYNKKVMVRQSEALGDNEA